MFSKKIIVHFGFICLFDCVRLWCHTNSVAPTTRHFATHVDSFFPRLFEGGANDDTMNGIKKSLSFFLHQMLPKRGSCSRSHYAFGDIVTLMKKQSCREKDPLVENWFMIPFSMFDCG